MPHLTHSHMVVPLNEREGDRQKNICSEETLHGNIEAKI